MTWLHGFLKLVYRLLRDLIARNATAPSSTNSKLSAIGDSVGTGAAAVEVKVAVS